MNGTLDNDQVKSKNDWGKLYLCATPIGNMEDITLRVLKALENVDYIAAEDTRRTRKILAKYNIKNRLVSYHQHNQAEKGKEIIESIKRGDTVAVTSDAGTPGISDPGAELAAEAIREGIVVEALPGAAAFLIALLVSGLPTERFVFEGFLPRKKAKRIDVLKELKMQNRTIIFYEAPHRIEKMLSEVKEYLGDRRVAVCRELTKKFEDIERGSISEIMERMKFQPPRGEYTIVIEGTAPCGDVEDWEESDSEEDRIVQMLKECIDQGLSKKDAVQKVAAKTGLKKNDIYKISLDL